MNFNYDNDKNDFFDGPDIPDAPKPEKRPALTPDNPDYWDRPENEFDHLRPNISRSRRTWIWILLIAVAAGIIIAAANWTFNPWIQEARQYGYIEDIRKEGEVFKTFEGTLLPYRNLMDTNRVYEGDIIFSVKDPSVAAQLLEAEYANRPVRVTFKRYHTPLPWRGSSDILVTAVDSVNPRDILPPDRQPPFVKEDNTD